MAETKVKAPETTGFVRGLGFWDSTMLVAGSMIGSGIFLVTPDIARQVGSPGLLLLVWVVTGVLTVAAALSYGELAAMMPKAGGQYVYLRESFSPFWAFLYGWTLFLVIQAGSVAAVGIAFAVYFGELGNWNLGSAWIIEPINLSSSYAISLSWQQFIAILTITLLTYINMRGLQLAKLVQNIFTSAKTLGLLVLIVVCFLLGQNTDAISGFGSAMEVNFGAFWTITGAEEIQPDLDLWGVASVSAASGAFGLMIAFCVAQVGSIFSADAWNYITFTAGEVKNPQRNVPLSLLTGASMVIVLYILVNVAYLVTLPITQIQNVPDDRVATAALNAAWGAGGATFMAIVIMISTFGCNNGLILAGARVFYTMARDGLFFRTVGSLNRYRVPGMALILQCIWSIALVLPRTRATDENGQPRIDPVSGAEEYGSLYGNLLDYVVFAILIFYVLTIAGLFVLRRTMPDAERPYRAWGYPVVPLLYILGASLITVVLVVYRTQTTWPGLLIVLTGVPVYFIWRKLDGRKSPETDAPAG